MAVNKAGDRRQGAWGRFFSDEQGSEAVEYVLIVGMIAVAAMSAAGRVGTSLLAKWQALNDLL